MRTMDSKNILLTVGRSPGAALQPLAFINGYTSINIGTFMMVKLYRTTAKHFNNFFVGTYVKENKTSL